VTAGIVAALVAVLVAALVREVDGAERPVGRLRAFSPVADSSVRASVDCGSDDDPSVDCGATTAAATPPGWMARCAGPLRGSVGRASASSWGGAVAAFRVAPPPAAACKRGKAAGAPEFAVGLVRAARSVGVTFAAAPGAATIAGSEGAGAGPGSASAATLAGSGGAAAGASPAGAAALAGFVGALAGAGCPGAGAYVGSAGAAARAGCVGAVACAGFPGAAASAGSVGEAVWPVSSGAARPGSAPPTARPPAGRCACAAPTAEVWGARATVESARRAASSVSSSDVNAIDRIRTVGFGREPASAAGSGVRPDGAA